MIIFLWSTVSWFSLVTGFLISCLWSRNTLEKSSCRTCPVLSRDMSTSPSRQTVCATENKTFTLWTLLCDGLRNISGTPSQVNISWHFYFPLLLKHVIQSHSCKALYRSWRITGSSPTMLYTHCQKRTVTVWTEFLAKIWYFSCYLWVMR
jgi:hypothetical protein